MFWSARKRNEREEPHRVIVYVTIRLVPPSESGSIDRSIDRESESRKFGRKQFCDRYSRRGFAGIRRRGRGGEREREMTTTITVFESFRIAIRKWWPRQLSWSTSEQPQFRGWCCKSTSWCPLLDRTWDRNETFGRFDNMVNRANQFWIL